MCHRYQCPDECQSLLAYIRAGTVLHLRFVVGAVKVLCSTLDYMKSFTRKIAILGDAGTSLVPKKKCRSSERCRDMINTGAYRKLSVLDPALDSRDTEPMSVASQQKSPSH